MNGNKKFHKANGPAFAVGELWDNGNVEILSVRQYGEGKWDFDITYRYLDGTEQTGTWIPTCTKDAWNFQVRHQHPADEGLKVCPKFPTIDP